VSEINGPSETSTTGAGGGATDKSSVGQNTETATGAATKTTSLEAGQRGPAAPATAGDASGQSGLKTGTAGEVTGQQTAPSESAAAKGQLGTASESAAANRGSGTGVSAMEAGQRGPADAVPDGAAGAGGQPGTELTTVAGSGKDLQSNASVGDNKTFPQGSDNTDVGATTTFPDKAAARQAFEGDAQAAARDFFGKATSKSTDFQVRDLGNGQYQMQYFSPANNPGYGKLYVLRIDSSGSELSKYKDTMGPDGLIERK